MKIDCPVAITFSNVRTFNPNANWYANAEHSNAYNINKRLKRGFNEHIVEVQYSNFTPLVMSPTGGRGWDKP